MTEGMNYMPSLITDKDKFIVLLNNKAIRYTDEETALEIKEGNIPEYGPWQLQFNNKDALTNYWVDLNNYSGYYLGYTYIEDVLKWPAEDLSIVEYLSKIYDADGIFNWFYTPPPTHTVFNNDGSIIEMTQRVMLENLVNGKAIFSPCPNDYIVEPEIWCELSGDIMQLNDDGYIIFLQYDYLQGKYGEPKFVNDLSRFDWFTDDLRIVERIADIGHPLKDSTE